MTSLQVALAKAGLCSYTQLLATQAHKLSKYDGLELCRKNVVRCNTAKKLKYTVLVTD